MDRLRLRQGRCDLIFRSIGQKLRLQGKVKICRSGRRNLTTHALILTRLGGYTYYIPRMKRLTFGAGKFKANWSDFKGNGHRVRLTPANPVWINLVVGLRVMQGRSDLILRNGQRPGTVQGQKSVDIWQLVGSASSGCFP